MGQSLMGPYKCDYVDDDDDDGRAQINLPKTEGPYNVIVEIKDRKGEVTCKGIFTWQISVKPKSQ